MSRLARLAPWLAIAVVALLATVIAIAPSEPPQRADHYVAPKPQSTAEALALLRQTNAQVGSALGGNQDRFDALESVHEYSYALENAVDFLLAGHKSGAPAALEDLDEAVQAMHYASEAQDDAKTQKWYRTMQPMIANAAALRPGQSRAQATRPQALSYNIVIKNHRFQPTELEVPAGRKLRLVIDNHDATPEEFESHDLAREKIIAGNSRGVIKAGPLAAGRYHFFGEFHPKTANGYLVVR